MNRKQKQAVALAVIQAAADFVEHFDEGTASVGPELDDVSTSEVAEQVSQMLKSLPGTAWDTRLPYPHK